MSETQKIAVSNSHPLDLQMKKLNELIKSLDAGVSVNSEDRPANANEFGVLKTSAVNNGSFIPHENKVIKEVDIQRARLNPIKGSIIISRMNTPQLVGEIGYVNDNYENLFLPDRLWQTNLQDNVSGKWLANLLTLSSFKKQIKNIASGTSNSMKNISKGDFLSLEIPYAPYEEQQKIASILSTWDKAIELKEKLIEQKKEQKKGLMQKLLTGEVRLLGFAGEWSELRLDKIAEIIMGQSPKSDSYNDIGKGLPLIQGNADCKNRKTEPRSWTSSPTKQCEVGDIIMTVRAPVGYVSRSFHQACIGRGVCVIRGKMNQDFLYYIS